MSHYPRNKQEAIAAAKLLKALLDVNEVSKILSAFIPAFQYKTVPKMDKWFLHGNFHLGGTVSGRLSSSKVNLQQLPSSGSKYAKAVKRCFKAPEGWLFVGADFASLEDRISALATKDPNKLKVYTDGYDGHCLRAHAYFSSQMPDIEDTVKAINTIEFKYESLRQKSKGPTFLLTYGGTYHGLMGLGFTKEEALEIETNYHKLYAESDEWVQRKLVEATKTGFVELAFGLRLRTPILAKTILNTSKTPYEAEAEGRTAGNALGQSYGLLNNRAANEFMQRVWDNPNVAHSVLPVAHIHDAQYFIIKEDMDLLEWVNTNLVECMSWQDLPDIKHDEVKLGAELEVFYPSWANGIKIPNNASKEDIIAVLNNRE